MYSIHPLVEPQEWNPFCITTVWPPDDLQVDRSKLHYLKYVPIMFIIKNTVCKRYFYVKWAISWNVTVTHWLRHVWQHATSVTLDWLSCNKTHIMMMAMASKCHLHATNHCCHLIPHPHHLLAFLLFWICQVSAWLGILGFGILS
jgi:hypothetical protein